MYPREAKVWGEVAHLFDKDTSVSLLQVNKGFRCSNHFHRKRYNYFKVIRGVLDIVIVYTDLDGKLVDASRIRLGPQEDTTIPPEVSHRFEVIEGGSVVEIYWTIDGSPVSKDDIVRYDEGGAI